MATGIGVHLQTGIGVHLQTGFAFTVDRIPGG
jgi:hypothetical protein